MKGNKPERATIITRFVILGILWLLLVVAMVVRTPKFTFYNAFVIVASGIIVFVPLYKKYCR